MDRARIESLLATAEQDLAAGGRVDLGEAGFWRAVGAIKRDPGLVDTFAERVGRIDREAFLRSALIKLKLVPGTVVMVIGTGVGLVAIGLGYQYAGLGQAVLLLLGTGILMVTTHGLAHAVVGALQGMRFTHWFIASVKVPQPGVKVDYATYLRVPASRRAWMHASGAIVTKVMPLVGLGAGVAMGAESWALWFLAVLTAAQVVTDILWSTRASDWKKFLRERRLAAESPGSTAG
jgi:hypothetical protein